MEKKIAKRKELALLFAYWYFRDRNEWLAVKDKSPISAARFYRTGCLSASLSLPPKDVLALANRMDKVAQADAGGEQR